MGGWVYKELAFFPTQKSQKKVLFHSNFMFSLRSIL